VTTAAAVFLIAAGFSAVIDWWAVAVHRKVVEYVAKPTTLALLIATAATLDPADDTQRAWFVVALGFSLVGDVALMLPSDRFVAGLAAFLLAHVAYSVGMVVGGIEGPALAIGVGAAIVAIVLLGRRIVGSAPPGLRGPVALYILVISAMVALAMGTGQPWIIAGALLFYTSDALIGWTRFVDDFPHSRVAVMVTYHLGQAGLVLGLL
jgi:uncharacterized membrane protein YhhN